MDTGKRGAGEQFSVRHTKGFSRELVLRSGETEGYKVVRGYIHLEIKEFNRAGRESNGEEKQLELIAQAIEAGISKVNQEIMQGSDQENERLVKIRGHLQSLLA